MTELKILYVEDEPDIRDIAKMSLESLGGFTITECRGGAEAVEKALGFMPDLFLLDVMMPGMNGPETLLKLREIPDFVQTPVIFMTAKVQAAELNEYMALGALGIIPKPFDPMTLPDEIRTMWKTRPQG